jgi:hypothetical protein
VNWLVEILLGNQSSLYNNKNTKTTRTQLAIALSQGYNVI